MARPSDAKVNNVGLKIYCFSDNYYVGVIKLALGVNNDGTTTFETLHTACTAESYTNALSKLTINLKQNIAKRENLCDKYRYVDFIPKAITISEQSDIEKTLAERYAKENKDRVWLVTQDEQSKAWKTTKMEAPLMTEAEAKAYILSKMFN